MRSIYREQKIILLMRSVNDSLFSFEIRIFTTVGPKLDFSFIQYFVSTYIQLVATRYYMCAYRLTV